MISPNSFLTNQIVFIKKNTQDNINLVHSLYSMNEQTQTKQQTKNNISKLYCNNCFKDFEINESCFNEYKNHTCLSEASEYDHEIINTMYGSACLKCKLEDDELNNKDSCEVRSL